MLYRALILMKSRQMWIRTFQHAEAEVQQSYLEATNVVQQRGSESDVLLLLPAGDRWMHSSGPGILATLTPRKSMVKRQKNSKTYFRDGEMSSLSISTLLCKTIWMRKCECIDP